MRGRALLEDMEYISDALIEEAMHYDQAQPGRGWRIGRGQKWGAAAACAAVLCASSVCFFLQPGKEVRTEHIEQPGDSAGAVGIGLQMDAEVVTDIDGQQVEEAEADQQPAFSTGKGAALLEDGMPDQDTMGAGDPMHDMTESKKARTVIDSFPPKEMQVVRSDESPEAQDEVLELETCYAAPEKGKCIFEADLENAMAYYGSSDDDMIAFQVVIDVFGDRTDDPIPYGELCLTEAGRSLLESEYQRLQGAGYQVSLSEDCQLTAVMSRNELDSFEPLPGYGYMFWFAGG